MSLMRFPSLFLLVGYFVAVQSGIILESKCSMDLTLERNDSAASTMQRLAQIEREAEAYFAELLTVEAETNVQLTNVLKVSMAVEQDRWTPDNTITLDTSITLVYRSAIGWPLMLDEVLDDVVTRYTIPSGLNFAEYPVRSFHFRGVKDDSKILYVEDDGDERSGSQKGLIVATSFLSVILILVSTVLLYITGGWDALQQAFTNCLFEEVDDDDDSNYLSRSKSTFQVQSTDENDHDDDDEEDDDEDEDDDDDGDDVYEGMEEASLEESTVAGLQTTPQGMLGAMPVTQGLGIKTPNPNGTYNGNEYTPAESEITDMTEQPMGITSMRKMPQSITPGATSGGLSHLIMSRLNNTNNK